MRPSTLLLLSLAACGPFVADDTSAADTSATDTSDPVDTADTADTADTEPTDFRLAGPNATTSTSGVFDTSGGCGMAYTLVEPPEWDVLVVLLHGLQRSATEQVINAEHLASFGVAVVVPTSCARTVLDIDQEQNGLDAVELAAAVGKGRTIYAGHSAGGLAAFVAAAADGEAVAFLGLDPVEARGIGAGVAGDLEVPVHAMIGVGGSCNVNNNFLPLLDTVPQARALRVTEADHCDFEDPTDWVCTLPCGTGSNASFSDAEIRATIRGLAAAYVAWQAGLDPSGESWWIEGGAGYEAMRAEGAIAPL